jgi:hypothetical protein
MKQGDKNELCPLRYAEKLALQMTGVKNGVILFPVKGHCGVCWF